MTLTPSLRNILAPAQALLRNMPARPARRPLQRTTKLAQAFAAASAVVVPEPPAPVKATRTYYVGINNIVTQRKQKVAGELVATIRAHTTGEAQDAWNYHLATMPKEA